MVSGFRLGEDHAKACVMLSLPVCKPWSPPESKTTRRVGRIPFRMENAHCATAGDAEQNGALHFTVYGAQS